MKKLIFLVLLSLQVLGCNSQKNKAVEIVKDPVISDTTQPQVNIRVNKKYDDKGNLIQYDSTYSYYYSSQSGNVQQLSSDSLFTQLRSKFRTKYDDWFSHSLDPVFFSDSLFKYDFLNKDYFEKRFELNKRVFQDLFREMDSLKTDMLKRDYSNGIMKRKN